MTPDELISIRSELTSIHQRLDSLQETIAHFASSQSQRMARLEERSAMTAETVNRAFEAISKHDTRLQALERNQPMQKMTSTWVINAAWACVGVVAALIAKRLIGIL